LDSGRTLHTYNFYTSCHLVSNLLERRTYLVGIERRNRTDLPPSVTKAKLKVGETIAAQNRSGIVVSKNGKTEEKCWCCQQNSFIPR